MEDTNRHKQLRSDLVEIIRKKGIKSEPVLQAILRVPRHLFVIRNYSPEKLYEDTALPIENEQTISQPYTVAYQTELLKVRKGEKILEVGTGSGYQAAVLQEMGAEVYSIERQQSLYEHTKKTLAELGYAEIKLFYGDGSIGLKEHAPFDKILITAAATKIPDNLLAQLKIGGIMIVPVNGNIQKMLRITKNSSTDNTIEECGEFRFVPMLSGIVKNED